MTLLFENFKLILSVAFALFLPGYFLTRAIDIKSKLPILQKLIFSFGLSIFAVDFLFLLMDRIGIALNFWSVVTSILTLIFIAFLFNPKPCFPTQLENQDWKSKKTLLVLTLIIFAVVIRLFFLSERLLPQTTDLGHHMYWSQYINQFQALPDYGMPDFVIGEHIIFSAIAILSGISVVSSMPIALLFLINIFSILTCFAAIYELTRSFTDKNNAQKIAIFTLIALGIFYAASSPQAKFVSGGVIGNVIGNFFIALSFLLLAKFIHTRFSRYSALFVLTLTALAYTHHLSSFMFLYIFIGILIILFLIIAIAPFFGKFKIITAETWNFIKSFFNWKTILAFLFFLFFLFFVRIPSYLNSSAIDTAVGDPSKETRTGLTLNSIIETTGPWRFFYGLIGVIALIIILFLALKKNYPQKILLNIILSSSVILAWGLMIFAMSYAPGMLKVDIPSNRIGSYITYPFAFLSAIGVFYLFQVSENKINRKIFIVFVVVVMGTGFVSGLTEISANKKTEVDNKEVYQTYAAAKYLEKIVLPDEQILKDHIYLAGDAWIKIFFMKDYRYPLSRTTLKRYDDPVSPRETCTRDMIAIPDSEIGKNCFLENKVKYVVLKNGFDTTLFEKSSNFSKIFANGQTVIFERNY